jgi:hypothetical protein
MKDRLIVALVTILSITATVNGCGDAETPLGANAGVFDAAADSLFVAGDSIAVVKRDVRLAHDVSVSQEIGPSGGTVRLDEAGLTLDFSAGAVSAPVVITARILAGDFIVFTCEPHGLVFEAPVTALLDLKKVGLNKGQLVSGHYKIGYIEAPEAVDAVGRVAVYEQLPVAVRLSGHYATFRVPHFSTLALASGTYRRTN